MDNLSDPLLLHVQYDPKAGFQLQTTSILLQLRHQLLNHVLLSVVLFFGALGLVHVIRILVNRLTHLSQFKGPTIAAYTRLWLCKRIASGDSAKEFIDINKKYGSIARVGPNNLMTDDPGFVQRILAARSSYTRAPWFDAIRVVPHITNIVSERDSKKHDRMRHKMSAGYAGRELDMLESEVAERMTELMNHIDRKYAINAGESVKVMDMARLIQFLAVDVITQLCFGKPLGFISNGKDMFDFLKTIETQLPIVQHFTVINEFNTLIHVLASIPFLNRFIVPSSRDTKGIGVIMGICRNVINERYSPSAKLRKDLLGSFKKHGITADEAETELTISLVAGSDTTATSMRAILLHIISNPRVYNRLQAEIDSHIEQGLISSPILDEEARKLPYLQACIKEGLRRYPPITQLRERMAPPEGDTYEGHIIPPNTFIGINAWGLQLNPVFGPDADVFRPERWLEADADQLKAMSQVQELVFGFGSTKCLGIPIATMNLNKIFVELLRRFDLAVANPAVPWKSLCYGIFFQKEFNLMVTRRQA